MGGGREVEVAGEFCWNVLKRFLRETGRLDRREGTKEGLDKIEEQAY